MTTTGGTPEHDEDVIVDQADARLAALRRDGVGEPGAADVVVHDPFPVDPAESALYLEDLEAERGAADGLRRHRRST